MASELVLTDGVDTFRLAIRNSKLCTDQTLTVTGFDGNESVDEGATGDWINWEALPPDE